MIQKDQDESEGAETEHDRKDDGDQRRVHEVEESLQVLGVLGRHRGHCLEPEERQVDFFDLAEHAGGRERERRVGGWWWWSW